MTPPKPANLGMLNAYVERGDTREERAARLATVPDNLRQAVKRHVVAYYSIKAKLLSGRKSKSDIFQIRQRQGGNPGAGWSTINLYRG